jgi:hypothetical protein
MTADSGDASVLIPVVLVEAGQARGPQDEPTAASLSKGFAAEI